MNIFNPLHHAEEQLEAAHRDNSTTAALLIITRFLNTIPLKLHNNARLYLAKRYREDPARILTILASLEKHHTS